MSSSLSQQLLDIGFPSDKVEYALVAGHDTLERAMEFLLDLPHDWQPPQVGHQHEEGGTYLHVMTVCSVSADAAIWLLAKYGSADKAIEGHLANPDPAMVMTVCSVSSAVASVLLATYGSADEAIERHLENPDRSTVMTACMVSADVASTLLATHGSADEAIAFHSENPRYLDLVFAPHVSFAQRQRVFAYNLSVTDHFTRKLLYLALGPDGLPLSPAKHRAQIVRPLPLVKASWFFFLNTLGMKRRSGQQPQPPPHDCSYTIAEYSSVELLRCMFGCVGYVSQRLTAAAGGAGMRWGSEKWVVDRVIRGRSGNVQAASAARCGFHSQPLDYNFYRPLVKDNDHDLTPRDDMCLESVMRGRSQICRMLLECNADARLIWKGQPLLFYAAQMGRLEICHMLLHFSADPLTKDRKQWTPLHDAACNGSPDVCRLLLQSNVDPRAEGYNQRTALHNAAWYGHLEACRLLVEANADVAVRNSEGRTALRYALDFKHTKVAEYLRSIGAPE